MKFSYEQVRSLLEELQPFLKIGGVTNATMPTGDILRIKAAKYIEVFDWLSTILQSEEWAKVLEVWALLPPQIWKNYSMFGISDLAEQLLLDDACRSLAKLWRTGRPSSFFGKDYGFEDDENEVEETAG